MPARSADDRALVRRAQAGEEAAFRALVERHQGRAYAVARGIVRDDAAALDVVQEAFIKVHRSLHRFQSDAAFFTWLYRIVRNAAIDHLRKVGKAQAVDYDDTREHGAAPGDLAPRILGSDPERSLRRREIREAVEKALGRLQPAHREIIVLREIEGMSYKEIAEVVGCPQGTVMSRLFHARKRMQAALTDLLALGEEGA